MVSEAGMAVWVLLLATSLPLTHGVSPDAGGTVSVSTCLGWFAILEVLVLKSRVSPFLLVSYASRVVP